MSDDKLQSEQTSTTAAEELEAVAVEVVEELIERMGFEASVRATSGEDQLLLEVSGEDEELLVGKRGQTLEAMQTLVSRLVSRRVGGAAAVTVDVAGYRQRRADSLRELAHRLKDKALMTGRIVALNPMSPRDRRIVHLSLRDAPGVSTRSEGEGDNRRLLIVPESPDRAVQHGVGTGD